MRGLTGKVALVTGGGGAIGSAVCRRLAEEGCRVGIMDLDTKTLAREMARSGVLLNAVCPGPTDTPLFRSFLAEGDAGQKVYDALQRAIPLRRLGEPHDIPGLVAFLASDDAAYITGQVISVSGGLTMHG